MVEAFFFLLLFLVSKEHRVGEKEEAVRIFLVMEDFCDSDGPRICWGATFLGFFTGGDTW
jgi:hypothetical protein